MEGSGFRSGYQYK